MRAGILTQAQEAKRRTENVEKNEVATLDEYNKYLNNVTGGGTAEGDSTTGGTLGTVTGTEKVNTTVQDSLGNKVVVPSGFKVVNPTDNVEDGIIIEDINHVETAGSQFVWVPVGTIHTNSVDKTITLGRYVFNKDGTKNLELSKTEPEDKLFITPYSYTEGIKGEIANDMYAKDIEDFIKKVNITGGYYIGRYEARTEIERNGKTDLETQITIKPDEYIYNYVTQLQASKLSKNMYKDTNFESDLVNSYAWDTAIDFLQKCDDRKEENLKPYSQQNSLNTGILADKGTNRMEIKDVICNIYDMASNCLEWTTEMSDDIKAICVFRGGTYLDDGYKTYSRAINYPDMSDEVGSFRPILYL